MTDQRLGVDAGKLFFAHREGHYRDVLRRNTLVAQLTIEGHVGVAVDGGDHGRHLALGTKAVDIRHDALPVGMPEGGVVDHDVAFRDALALEVGLQDLVGGARIDVVGARQHPALHADLVHEVVHRRDGLLVGRGTGIEHVTGGFLTFVLHRVEQDAIQLLEHRQHRLARHRGPAAEHRRHLVLDQQLARLLREQRPVGGRIDHDGFEFLAQQATLLVLLVDEHEHGVLEGGFRNGHGARQGMQDTDLDGIRGTRQGTAQPDRQCRCGNGDRLEPRNRFACHRCILPCCVVDG